MILRIALACAALSLNTLAQEPGTMESLGLGRSRLTITMVERRGVPMDTKGKISAGKIEFREIWLQRELPKMYPGLEAVDVVDRVLTRAGPQGASATAERLLEVTGPTAQVESARAVIRRILAEPDRTLKFKMWAAIMRFPKDAKRPSKPKVERLTMKSLDQQLEAIASDESATVFENGSLELLNGRTASISVGSRISYVKDYRLSHAGERLFLEPIVDHLNEGLHWSLGAVYDSTSKKLALESKFKFVQVQKPIARFKGKVSLDNRELTIEKPIVAETRWESSGLTLGQEHAGFVVTGIKLTNIDGLASATQKAEVVLFTRFEVEKIEGGRLSGTVQGFDRATRLAFVRVKQGSEFEVGLKLEFSRDKKNIASGRVVEIVGNIVSVEIDDGSVRAGDKIQ